MSPEHLDPSERTLPEWLDELALASQRLARVEHSLELMGASHEYIEEVIWQARWKHRDECKAQIAEASRAAMTRRAALVESIMARLPVTNPFDRLQFAASLGDLEPARLEFLAAVRFETPSSANLQAPTHGQWYVEFELAVAEYRRQYGSNPSKRALAGRMTLEYTTLRSRLRVLEREGYDIRRLLAATLDEMSESFRS
jgi:hypothetical protein